jgi:hypothetical protein
MKKLGGSSAGLRATRYARGKSRRSSPRGASPLGYGSPRARGRRRVCDSGAISRTASCLAELLAQLVLGPHQGPLAGRWQALAGAIDIECEHGKRGAKGIGLSAPASFSRPFQGGGNPLRIARCEDALVEGQRVVVFGHMTRPAPPGPGSARRPAVLMRGTGLGRSSSFACHGFTGGKMAIYLDSQQTAAGHVPRSLALPAHSAK